MRLKPHYHDNLFPRSPMDGDTYVHSHVGNTQVVQITWNVFICICQKSILTLESSPEEIDDQLEWWTAFVMFLFWGENQGCHSLAAKCSCFSRMFNLRSWRFPISNLSVLKLKISQHLKSHPMKKQASQNDCEPSSEIFSSVREQSIFPSKHNMDTLIFSDSMLLNILPRRIVPTKSISGTKFSGLVQTP